MFDEAFQYDKSENQLISWVNSFRRSELNSVLSQSSPKILCVELLALAAAENCHDSKSVESAREDLFSALKICDSAMKTFDFSSSSTKQKSAKELDYANMPPFEFLSRCPEISERKTLENSLPAAAGVVTWIESALRRDPEKSHKIVFALLETCAKSHAKLYSRVLECISTAVEVAGRGCGDDVPEACIDVALSVVEIASSSSDDNHASSRELVLDCLDECIEVWTPNHINQTHVKRFLSSLFELAAPPYSRAFAVRALRALHVSRAKKGASASIDLFLEEVRVKKREFRPSLGPDAIDMLELACQNRNVIKIKRVGGNN